MAKIGQYHKIKNLNLKQFKRALCFGSFDPLHFGHIRLFKRASLIADEVFVVTEADYIIENDKNRLVFSKLNDRIDDIMCIKHVRDIGVRDDTKDRQYWADYFNADVLVVGSDHDGSWSEGEKLSLPIVVVPYTEEISSTYLRNL